MEKPADAAPPQGTNAGAAETVDTSAAAASTRMTPEDVAYDSGYRVGHHDGIEAGQVKERLRALRAQLRNSVAEQLAAKLAALVSIASENDEDLFAKHETAPEPEESGGFWESLVKSLPDLVEKLKTQMTQGKERNATPAEVMQARYGHVLDLLKRYGEHTDACPSPTEACSCGWDEIAKSLAEPEPEPEPAAPAPPAPTDGQTP